mgnify:FL=1
MAQFKATSNVVFNVNGKEQNYNKDVVYDIDVKVAESLNTQGKQSHPELSPFFEPVDEKEETKEAGK